MLLLIAYYKQQHHLNLNYFLSETTIDDLKELAINAQSDLSKIRKINILVRQAENEDDIIGKVHESIVCLCVLWG